MGDYITHISPADPWHVPTQGNLQRTYEYLQTLQHDVKEPSVAGCVFAGPSGFPLTCPVCLTFHEDAPWALDACDDAYNETTQTFARFELTAPCCGKSFSFSDVPSDARNADHSFWAGIYEWGFANASICIWNFEGAVTTELRAELERVMGCPVRFTTYKL